MPCLKTKIHPEGELIMTRTITLTLAIFLTAVSGWATAQQVTSLRGEEVSTVDKAPAEVNYQGKRPGMQKPIARTFDKQPPLIPHAITNFDEITLEENQCLDCHGPEKFKQKKAPKLGVSHLANGTVSMARYQCNSCHVPQADAKPLVENRFVGHLSKTPPKP